MIEGCLFCAIDAHKTATEVEKRFMYCHIADFARLALGQSPAEYAHPCTEHSVAAIDAAPKLGEAMGMPAEVQDTIRDKINKLAALSCVAAGGGSG
jgi:hypothetical protein